MSKDHLPDGRAPPIFSSTLKLLAGQWFMIEWVPRHPGLLVITIKGQAQVPSRPLFFGALMSIWLGHRDWKSERTRCSAVKTRPGRRRASHSARSANESR